MDKYQPLWDYVRGCETFPLNLSFDEIEQILGFPIDHSFLNYKKKLSDYGLDVKKISLKNKVVTFDKKN